MIEELDIYGVFVPSLLAWMVLAFLITLIARRALSVIGVYDYVWHRPLFDVSLYVVMVGIVVAIARTFL